VVCGARGLLRSKRYKPQQYIEHGATRMVERWKEIEGNLPKLS